MNGVHPRNHQNGPYKGVNFGTYIPRFSSMDTRPYQQAPFKTILLVLEKVSIEKIKIEQPAHEKMGYRAVVNRENGTTPLKPMLPKDA